jgi:hypothetical protein
MTSPIFSDEVDPSDTTAGAVKAKECAERQEEMDAIASFSNHAEFPEVAATYVQAAPEALGTQAAP